MHRSTIQVLAWVLSLGSDAAAATDYYAAPGAPVSGLCSQATPCDVNYAISSSSGPGIRILLTAGTYATKIFLPYGKSMQIVGAGNQTTTVQGSNASQCDIEFQTVLSTTPADVSFSDMTIDATVGAYGICATNNSSSADLASLSILRSIVISGSASGIYITGNVGTLTVTESTVNDNFGGIVFEGHGALTINRSLVAFNKGGFGGIDTADVDMVITNSTILGSVSSGGYLITNGKTLALSNATVLNGGQPGATISGLTISTNYSVIDGTCSGTTLSGDYSVESPGGTCGLTLATSKNVADVGLAGLTNNGGPTQTALPQAGSPVIGIGGPDCQPVDQRDFVRTGLCDAGAAQLSANTPDIIYADGFDSF